MTIATIAPARPSVGTLRPYRWTVKKFHDACERKVWGDGKRMILIRGELFEFPPMNPLHAAGVLLAHRVFLRLVPDGLHVRQQTPLVLDLETDPIPDLSVVAGDVPDYLNVHPTTAVLVLEVAATSLDVDMTVKAELYATGKIPEYWIADLANRQVYVLRDSAPIPGNGGASYRTHKAYGATESITPLFAPDKPVRVADLLP